MNGEREEKTPENEQGRKTASCIAASESIESTWFSKRQNEHKCDLLPIEQHNGTHMKAERKKVHTHTQNKPTENQTDGKESAAYSENDVHSMTKMVCNGNSNGNGNRIITASEQVNEKNAHANADRESDCM